MKLMPLAAALLLLGSSFAAAAPMPVLASRPAPRERAARPVQPQAQAQPPRAAAQPFAADQAAGFNFLQQLAVAAAPAPASPRAASRRAKPAVRAVR